MSRERRLPICGPNCYGVFNVHARTPTFSGDMPEPLVDGHVALISQSGGFSTMIAVPLMRGRGVGFSYIVSCGNQAGTTIEDYMEFLVEDERTRVIAPSSRASSSRPSCAPWPRARPSAARRWW